MGTGRPPLVPVDTIDVFRPDTLWGACRMALGVTNLGQLLVNQVRHFVTFFTFNMVCVRLNDHNLYKIENVPYFGRYPPFTCMYV